LANLEALCRQGVGGFRDDDPGYEIGDGANTGEDDEERSEDAGYVEVPAVVEGKAGADPGDHAILPRARELAAGWVVARRWRRSGGDGRSAGWTETGGWFDLLAAFRAEHGRVSEDTILPQRP